MDSVNMHEAKTSLSKLVEAIESGQRSEIVIARNGKPVAKLVALESQPVHNRLGVAAGEFEVPDDIDADNAAVLELFSGSKP